MLRRCEALRIASPNVIAALFVACAGAGACVAGHQIIHAAGDAGLFRTSYDAYDHVALLPVFFGALIVGLFALAVAIGSAFAVPGRLDEALRKAARTIMGRRRPEIFVAIAAIQFCTLYTMEGVEQMIAFGHPDPALTWTGAPLTISLFVHACCTLVAFGCLVSAMRFTSTACALVARAAHRTVTRLECAFSEPTSMQRARRAARRDALVARHFAKRAPPLVG